MKDRMPTQARSWPTEHGFSSIFGESIVEVAQKNQLGRLRALLHQIESRVSERLREMIQHVETILSSDDRVAEYWEIRDSVRETPFIGHGWMLPDRKLISEGRLSLAAHMLADCIARLAEIWGAAESVDYEYSTWMMMVDKTRATELHDLGRLSALRDLSADEEHLIAMFNEAALLNQISTYVEALRAMTARSARPSAVAEATLRSFNLGSLVRLSNILPFEADVDRARTDKRQKAKAGSESALSRTETMEAWREFYDHIARKIQARRVGSGLSKADLCKRIVREIDAIGDRARKGDDDVPQRYCDLLSESKRPWGAHHAASTVRDLLFGRRRRKA